jgi:hypothetical protein
MSVYVCGPGELKTKCSHPDLTRNLRKELRNHAREARCERSAPLPPARIGGERSSNDVVRRNRHEKGSRHPEVGSKRVDHGLRGRSGEIELEEEKLRSKLQEQIEEFGFTPPRAEKSKRLERQGAHQLAHIVMKGVFFARSRGSSDCRGHR